jgi:L-aspartate oxidase
VLLDATALGRTLLESRFPTITAAGRAAGLDWAVDPLPVAPAAHYWMGGVETDVWGRTSLPGLFAVGEVARTGAHGANRLASNSLLEAAVFADRAVRALGQPWRVSTTRPAQLSHQQGETTTSIRGVPNETVIKTSSADLGTLVNRQTLQQLLWNAAGVHRSGVGLTAAAAALAEWSAPDPSSRDVAALEDRNLLDLSRLLVAAALAREESRGAHYRSDFPQTRPELARSVSHVRRSQSRTLIPAKEAIAC